MCRLLECARDLHLWQNTSVERTEVALEQDSRSAAEHFLDAHPVGSAIVCYYMDKNAPSSLTLDRDDLFAGPVIVLGLLSVLTVILVACLAFGNKHSER